MYNEVISNKAAFLMACVLCAVASKLVSIALACLVALVFLIVVCKWDVRVILVPALIGMACIGMSILFGRDDAARTAAVYVHATLVAAVALFVLESARSERIT